MGQEVADAGDLPLSKLNELSEFLAELDAGRPGGEVHLTEQQNRIAEVANLPRPVLEAFPSLAVELAPRLSRAPMTSEDGGLLSLKARLDRGVPLDVGIELDQKRVEIIGVPRRDGALDGLYVLLRHRPPSISRRPLLSMQSSTFARERPELQHPRERKRGLGAVPLHLICLD